MFSFKKSLIALSCLTVTFVNANIDKFTSTELSSIESINTSNNAQPFYFDSQEIELGHIEKINNFFSVTKSGVYKVNYTINWELNNNENEVHVKTFLLLNNKEVVGSQSYSNATQSEYNKRTTNTGSFYVQLSDNEQVSLQYTNQGSNLGMASSIPNESSISFELIKEIEKPMVPDPNADLIKTGDYGNLALRDKNGLYARNYTASATYVSDSPSSAFDGYVTGSKKINQDAEHIAARGVWISPIGKLNNHWLSIDFNRKVRVSGFRVYKTDAGFINRMPKNIVIQASEDGINFEDKESFTLEKIVDQALYLNEQFDTRYFRFLMKDNHGSTYVTQVDELEVF